MALEGIREKLSREKVGAFLVSKLVNVRYLSGFTGSSAFILISSQDLFFVTDPRYGEQASSQIPPSFDLVVLKPGERLSSFIKGKGWSSVAVEDALTLAQYNSLKEGLEGMELVIWKGVVEAARKIKGPWELERIREAVALAQEAFSGLKERMHPGVVEKDFALELEFFMRRRGAEGVAFPFIVASGSRSALPHGEASSKTIDDGDLVVLDFGVRWRGYHSDMTRTLKFGEWQGWERDIYRVVLDAQQAALDAIGPGVEAKEVDAVARRIVEEAGYGEFFGHGLGHGVGLEIHEAPTLSPTSQDVLEEGMVFTVEPGVYLPGKGGVRIEDMVYLGSGGPEVLTSLPKEVEG